jgi:hypothetical protein
LQYYYDPAVFAREEKAFSGARGHYVANRGSEGERRRLSCTFASSYLRIQLPSHPATFSSSYLRIQLPLYLAVEGNRCALL